MYREHKYWYPVYHWAQRERVDMPYLARLIAHAAKVREIEKKLEDGRISEANRKALQEEKKAVVKAKPNHFDHLETAAAYRILKVC